MRWLVACFGLLLSMSVFGSMMAQRSRDVVVAYVFPQNNLIQPGEIAAEKLTRINYAFANLQGGRVVNGFNADDENLARLVVLKQQNPALTVLISVGGWSWSGNFSDMALTGETRRAFIDSAVEFVEKHNLDGLDIDWEYPGQAGAGNRFRPEDKQNYTLLLGEIRSRFKQEEKRIHRTLYLTIATGASSAFLAHTEMNKVQRYVDTINLMAYDYYVPGGDTITGNHAPLYADPDDPKSVSADRSVREYEQAGVHAEKIVLGVPFYGHLWSDVEDANHGLFRPGKSVPYAFARYRDISANMLAQDFVRYWDAASSAPYLYSAEKRTFVSYEDPESLGLKCRYVLDHKLGGIMFWEYGGDSGGTLLNAIDNGLRQKQDAAVPVK
jgi:chitinase